MISRLDCTLSQHGWVTKAVTQHTSRQTSSSIGVLKRPEHESAQLHSPCKLPLLCPCDIELLWWNKWTLPDAWRTMSVSGELCLLLACFIQTVRLTLPLAPSRLMDFTFLLSAGGQECFFQPASRNERIEIEYQVN